MCVCVSVFHLFKYRKHHFVLIRCMQPSWFCVSLLSCCPVALSLLYRYSALPSGTVTVVPLFSCCPVALSLLCRFSAAVQWHCHSCAAVQLLSSGTVTVCRCSTAVQWHCHCCAAAQLLSSSTVTVVPQTVSNIYGYEEDLKGSSNCQQNSGIF